MQLIVRRYGNLIDISPDGQSPTPPEIVEALIPHMTYLHKTLLRGAEAYDVSGQRHGMRVESRQLYKMEYGRLTCGAGFLARVVRTLESMGHTAHLLEIPVDNQRPERFQANWDLVRRYIQFRPRQEECLQRIANSHGGIIKAVTGFGKSTLIGAASLLYHKAKIHVVTKSRDVAERLVRGLTQFIPNVGIVHGGKHDWRRVTIITADSLHHSDGDADFLFADECHQLMAPTYSEQLAGIYRKSRNFGFSATPYSRMDGAHARLESLFGPCLFELPYQEAVALGLVVPIRVRWLPIRLDHNPAGGKQGVPKKRWGIWRNDARNGLIAEAARSYADDQQTLILVETVEHLVHLWQHLKDYALMYGDMKPLEYESYVKSRMLPHDFIHMNPERRRAMRDAFERGELKKVIATDVWATGVDFAQLAVLIRADERDSEILDQQGPGRVSRVYAGKEYGEVVDCIDYFDKGLQAKSRSRFRSYEALGWEQDWPRGRRQIGNPDVHTQRLF